jgi:hypothetical protein
MNPKFHCGGPNIQVLKNVISGDTVTHVCLCSKCGESFLVQESVEQWKRD